MPNNPGLVAVSGPTGSGKSHLALDVAQMFGGEILNCDSLQIYRYFNIGTAKLLPEQRRDIPHHLMDVADPDEVFTAGDFARAGRESLKDMARRGKLPVVTGGTGFYLRALIEGLAPGPERDVALRVRLQKREERRAGSLHRILRRLDARSAARMHPNDVPKVMRALEICLSSRQTATEVFAAGRDALEGFRVLRIGLFPDREELYQRLDRRVEAMFAGGLVEETTAILARGYPENAKPFEAIGYKQALQVLREELSVKDAVFYAKRATRQYAKRQMTWFRQEPGMEIFRGFGDDPAVVQAVLCRVGEFLQNTNPQ